MSTYHDEFGHYPVPELCYYIWNLIMLGASIGHPIKLWIFWMDSREIEWSQSLLDLLKISNVFLLFGIGLTGSIWAFIIELKSFGSFVVLN